MATVVEIDMSPMESLLADASVAQVGGLLAEVVLADSNEYSPEDTRAMRDSSYADITEPAVVWPKEYAPYVYAMDDSHIHTDKNPNAHSAWVEYAEAEHSDEWAEFAAKQLFEGYLQ
jgi:hypothetical protein